MAQLIPSSGSFIINTPLQNFVVGVISTDLLQPEWSCTITPINNAPDDIIPRNLIVNISNVVSLNYHSSENLMPIEELDYIDDKRQLHTITSISQLPEPNKSPKITRYIVNPRPYIEYNVNVTVNGMEETETGGGGNGGGSSTTQSPVTLHGTYTIRIVSNFNEHVSALKSLISQRETL